MTDRDESSKGFLERWSRRKIDAERETPAPAKADVQNASPVTEVRPPEALTKNDAKIPDNATSKPGFDLASLPSLDSITAVTDVRAFLAPGVPTELARAALRRAWVRARHRGRDRPRGRCLRADGLQLLPDQGGPGLLAAGRLRGEAARRTARSPGRRASAPTLWGKSRRQNLPRKYLQPLQRKKNPASRRLRPVGDRSHKPILCNAIIILHRTIIVRTRNQKSPRIAASTAVHCLSRK